MTLSPLATTSSAEDMLHLPMVQHLVLGQEHHSAGRLDQAIACYHSGLLAAGNDAGGIATYSSTGAKYGYELIWVMLVITVSLAVVQEMCARLGAATGRGLLDLIRERCQFEIGDATELPSGIGQFDIVLAANLIDRVKSPRDLLDSFPALVRPGGHLILSSPYTWLEDFTPKSDWLGGKYGPAGDPTWTLDGIKKSLLGAFDLRVTKDLPFLIREHARKFQWSVAQATVWQKR